MIETFELAREKDAAKKFACSQPYLKKKRLDGTFQEGVHWIRLGKRSVRYVIPVTTWKVRETIRQRKIKRA